MSEERDSMAKKQYNVKTGRVAALPRSERLRGLGATVGAGSVSSVATVDVSGKLDRDIFDSMFERVDYGVDDDGNALWYIKAKASVLSVGEMAGFANRAPGAGSVIPGTGGSGVTRLRLLDDVSLPEAGIADGAALVYDSETGLWRAQAIKQGLDTDELEAYLTEHDYARMVDLPSLAGYATEGWVTQRMGSMLPREDFDSMFEKVVREDGTWYIKAKASLWSVGEVAGYLAEESMPSIGPSLSLGALTDVDLSGVGVGHVLSWDGYKWINKPVSVSGGGGLDTAAGDARYVLKAGDMMTGALNINMPVEPIVRFYRDEVNKGSVGYYNGYMYLYNAAAAKSLRLYDDGALKIGDNTLLHAGNYASILDDRYVNAAGDEMTGKLTIKTAGHGNQLTIYRSDGDSAASVKFSNESGVLGYIGIGGSGSSVPYDAYYMRGESVYRIWHSGNDGAGSDLDADMLDGLHASEFVQDAGGGITAKIYTIPAKRVFSGINLSDAPVQGWVSGLVLGSNWNNSHYQHYLVEAGGRWYATREYADGSMKNWKTFAFLSDNVASASKLANTRTIWGQNFNGEGNVTGNLTLGAGNAIIGGTSVEILKDHNNNNVTLNASNGDLFLGYWHTDKLRFYSGNSAGTGTQKMILLANGYFGVGTETPAYLCDINGETIVRGWIRTTGQRGWYNETYGGGIYMTEGTTVKVSHGKHFEVPNSLALSQTSGAGAGIALYGGPSHVANCGILFALTSTFGKHGGVQGDWATYFTMSGATNRGWCFRLNGTGVVASISAAGTISAKGEIAGFNTSDARLKTNIRRVRGAVETLRGLGGYCVFDYIEEAPEEQRYGRLGLIYQRVLTSKHLAALMATERDNGYGALNYLKPDYINLIGASVLEVDDKVARLKKEVRQLRAENEEMKREINRLKAV